MSLLPPAQHGTPGPMATTPTQVLDTEAAVLRLDQVLRFAAARGVSDVHFKAGQRPLYRRFGVLSSRRDEPVLTDDELVKVTVHWLPAEHRGTLQTTGEARFCIGLVGCGRFRVTLVRHRGGLSMTIRPLPGRVLSPRELGLPKVLQSWSALPSGLVVVASPPGGGRTWTLAALLEQINTAAPAPRTLVTLEQPVELMLDDKAALVRHREIGPDVPDVRSGIASALRSDTDVIAVADPALDTLPVLLSAAEQGRLVLVSVAAPGVVVALQRLLEAGPIAEAQALRLRFLRHWRGAVSTAMLPNAEGKGVVAAAEVAVPTRGTVEAIRAGDWDGMQVHLEQPQGRQLGLQSLDSHILELAQSGAVAIDVALAAARDPDTLRGKLTGNRPKPLGPTGFATGQMPAATGTGVYMPVSPPNLPGRDSQ
jgi:twitching motility protein PilT